MLTPKAVELSGDGRPFAWQNKPQFAIRPVRIAAAGGTRAEVVLIWAGTRGVRRPRLRKPLHVQNLAPDFRLPAGLAPGRGLCHMRSASGGPRVLLRRLRET